MHQGARLHQPRWLWHTMHAMLLSIAMLSPEAGVEPQSFPVPVFPLDSSSLLLLKRDVVSYGGVTRLPFCVPNWKALSERLSSHAESHENDRRRSVPLEEPLAQLDEKRHSYPCSPL